MKIEKEGLQEKVEELEEQQKIILQASEMHSQEQKEKHQEHISSLTDYYRRRKVQGAAGR